jgi:outer membrane protein insertion porin family
MFKKLYIFLLVSIFILSGTSFAQSYYDYTLGSINFSGNNSFSESELLKNIESKESPMWFWVFLNSFTPFGDAEIYFDSSKISIDKIALTELYHANGFFRVKVSNHIEVDTKNKKVDLFYDINENRPFYYGKLNIIGLNNLSEYEHEQMRSQSITIDSTQRYTESQVQQNINSIKRFLANNGYVIAHYDSTVITIDTLNYRADVGITFSTGNKFVVSDVIINKTGTQIEQITNDLINEITGIKRGTVYDQSQVDRSELRLLKTELFTSININPIISDTVDKKIPIEVNANIGSLNALSPEIKADNEFNSFNAGLGISYTRKNFLGDARKLVLSTSFRFIDIPNFNFGNIFKSADNRDSTYQGVLDLNLKLEQPYFFGKPILTTTEIYYRAQTLTGLTEKTYGGSQKFDFEMPYYTFITLLRPNITIEAADQLVNYPNDTSSISIASLTPGLGVELGSAKTNDIQFPTEGYFLFLTPEVFQSQTKYTVKSNYLYLLSGQKEASIEGSTYFYRLQTGISHYASTNYSKTSVLATKIRIGYIQSFLGSNNELIPANQLIPPNKTFYAGGSNSVRGWRSRELVPRDTITYIGYTTETNSLRGGTFWLEGSFEFRRKLNQYLGFALFADYGNTWNSWKDVTWKEFAVSLGGGIRFYTSIAPFRIDFGTKFYNPYDQQFIFNKVFLKNLEFHFGIGEAF